MIVPPYFLTCVSFCDRLPLSRDGLCARCKTIARRSIYLSVFFVPSWFLRNDHVDFDLAPLTGGWDVIASAFKGPDLRSAFATHLNRNGPDDNPIEVAWFHQTEHCRNELSISVLACHCFCSIEVPSIKVDQKQLEHLWTLTSGAAQFNRSHPRCRKASPRDVDGPNKGVADLGIHFGVSANGNDDAADKFLLKF